MAIFLEKIPAGQCLNMLDRVVFSLNGEAIEYEVCGDFLSEVSGKDNCYILSLLGVQDNDKYTFFEDVTGFRPSGGDWPSFNLLTAQTQFVNAIYTAIEAVEQDIPLFRGIPERDPVGATVEFISLEGVDVKQKVKEWFGKD